MNPAQLLAQFDRISEAPDAIPRLRRFILDLAVRGKLVEQDPSDEPAAELLKRIQAEKARLVKAGEIKKLEMLEPVVPDEISFTISTGWEVVRMGWLARKLGAGSTPLGGKSVYQNEGVPFLRSQNVHDGGVRLDDVALISRAVHDRMSGTHVQQDDILLNITGASIGRCALVPCTFIEGNVSQHVAIIRLFLPAIREFIHLSLTSPLFQKVIDDVQVGVSREGLSMQKLRQFPMLLPPLAEQHRIVAKVDELMALCDRLEAAQAQRESRRDRLVVATHAHLSDLSTLDSQPSNFFINHLPHLTARPEHIKQLRQTILNLAVRGKLVPQNPQDEAVSNLVARIAAGQRELITRGRLNQSRTSSDMNADSGPHAIPGEWRWTRLAKLISFGPQNGVSPKPTSNDKAPKALTLTATTSGTFNPAYFKHVELCDADCENYWLSSGDVLFQRGNTREYVGMAAVFDGPAKSFVFPDLMIRVRFSESMNLRFIHLALISPPLRSYFSGEATGASSSMPKISQDILLSAPIPVPPLGEQRRIVAKVDELLALCDRLEAQLTTAQTESRQLLDAALQRVLVQ
jgi:type I restriction enzyme S subunit